MHELELELELKRKGVIAGYRTVLSPAAVGVGFVAYVNIGLVRQVLGEQQAFGHAMTLALMVRECHNVTGAVE